MVGGGELDLLVRFGDESAVVEVRSVSDSGAGVRDPIDAFTKAKLAQVRKLGRLLDPPVYRVDLIAIRYDQEGVDVRWLPRFG